MLDIGAAGVVESLLRTTVRMPRQGEFSLLLESQVCCGARGGTQTAIVLSVAGRPDQQTLGMLEKH